MNIEIKYALIHIFSRFGYIRNYFLFPISGFLRVHHIPFAYEEFRFIDEIKNKYKGQRCFIIATGPSLTVEDVERLNDERTT